MRTEIFADRAAFAARSDLTVNGVDAAFAAANAGWDQERGNDGCWSCSGCSGCSGCSDCSDCSYCSYCSYCSDCSECSHCFGCYRQKGLNYAICNVEFTKEEYEAKMKEMTE